MNTGVWFTQEDYTGYVFPSSGFTNVSGGTPGGRCARKLGRGFYRGDPGAQEIARLNNLITADKYQIGNEPNLKFEGAWTRSLYRQRFLEVRPLMQGKKLGWAGMSPSDDPNVTQDGPYLDWYSDAVGVADFVVGHIYGQNLQQLTSLCDSILSAIAPLDLCIGELNFGPGPGVYLDKNVWARTVLRPFLFDYMRYQPRITDCIYFADTWNADTPIGTTVDARGTEIMSVLAEAANVPSDYNIGTGFKKCIRDLGWTPLENEIYHFESNPLLQASMAVFDKGHATWDPRSNETVAIANDGTLYTDGGNNPIDPSGMGKLVKIAKTPVTS